MMEDYYVPIDTWPNGMNRMIVPLLNQVKDRRVEDLINEATNLMLSDVGIDPSSFKGNAIDAKKAIQKEEEEFSKYLILGMSVILTHNLQIALFTEYFLIFN